MDRRPDTWEQSFAFPAVDRPWWRAVFVSTIDGAAQDATGTSGTLGGSVDSTLFATLRSMADVIVVGAETASAEGYRPVEPHEIDDSLRPGQAPVPAIAVASRRLDIPEALAVPGTVILTTEEAPDDRKQALAHCDLVIAGTTDLDWSIVTEKFTRRGWLKVQCEGGPRLLGALIASDSLDELCLTIAPVLAAGSAVRIAHSIEPVALDMELQHAEQIEGVLLTRWIRHRS